ncbi:Dual-specificity RNA methyltransferase RlmN [Eubacterium plexicaudatum ASF492]|uniref:Radical SAM core domain-containing protein n=1 Tax=Eubacterium plexicaudatum ASF492 TaxID=1235802 RepID=N2AL08_9FIRM|nr:Dual-specificity RNA methyltransferase RlmN [Eubacterium plexicaudatum ASF492]
MITLYNQYSVSNNYVGSDWNYEKTTKYIFKIDCEYIEAGYFIHYLKDTTDMREKKQVIELPSSYGCMMKCGFCASSQISHIRSLTAEEIYDIFLYIYNHNHLQNKTNILVSMMGIGDLYFTINNVEKVLKKINNKNKNIIFSISSCCWTQTMLKKVEILNTVIQFRTIQITYITHHLQKIQNIIQYYKIITYNADSIIQMIYHSTIPYFKINYILIEGINDSDEDFLTFITKFKDVKDKITVRISKINPTRASIKNGLTGSSIDRMEEFEKLLSRAGYKTYLFYSCNDDNMNCGQLVTEKLIQ